MHDDDKLTALERRVADLEQIPGHGQELRGIRDERERAAREADGSTAADEAWNRQRIDALMRLRKATSNVRYPLGALRDVLGYARALMPSDVGTLRDALPALITAIDRVQGLAAEAPEVAWPEPPGLLRDELLRDAERFRDDGTTALVQFDRRWAEQEAARRPPAPVG